jgi:plasmid maintenance system antidote protein VapI
MTLELVEERSAVNLVNERLDVEHGERMKLEKQLDEQKEKFFNLQDASEKLELELLCAKSDINR